MGEFRKRRLWPFREKHALRGSHPSHLAIRCSDKLSKLIGLLIAGREVTASVSEDDFSHSVTLLHHDSNSSLSIVW